MLGILIIAMVSPTKGLFSVANQWTPIGNRGRLGSIKRRTHSTQWLLLGAPSETLIEPQVHVLWFRVVC